MSEQKRKWCGPKVGTQKENTDTRFRGKKDILTKLQRIVSNIGSRTPVLLLLLLLPYAPYYSRY